jgi:hypothetical protein
MNSDKIIEVENRKTPVSIMVNVTRKFEAALNNYIEHMSREKEITVVKESVIVGVMEKFLEDFEWEQRNSKYSTAELFDLPHLPDDAL